MKDIVEYVLQFPISLNTLVGEEASEIADENFSRDDPEWGHLERACAALQSYVWTWDMDDNCWTGNTEMAGTDSITNDTHYVCIKMFNSDEYGYPMLLILHEDIAEAFDD